MARNLYEEGRTVLERFWKGETGEEEGKERKIQGTLTSSSTGKCSYTYATRCRVIVRE